jgi:hypothetical protein
MVILTVFLSISILLDRQDPFEAVSMGQNYWTSTAPDLQTSLQEPHFEHKAETMRWLSFFPPLIASLEQTFAHAPHPVQSAFEIEYWIRGVQTPAGHLFR